MAPRTSQPRKLLSKKVDSSGPTSGKRRPHRHSKAGESSTRPGTTFKNDVYEYDAPKSKGKRNNRNEAALLDRDEIFSQGGPNGGNYDADLKARLVGEEGLGSDDDDEEIDSDEAFQTSDDEEFAGFFSRKKPHRHHKRKEKQAAFDIDLNEDDAPQTRPSENSSDEDESTSSPATDEDDEMSGSPSEFVDVLDILDGRGESWNSEDEQMSKPVQDQLPDALSREASSQEESEEAEGEPDEYQDLLSTSDDDDEEPANDALTSFIHSLPSTSSGAQKRVAPQTSTLNPQPQKRRRVVLQERTEAGEENPFRAVASSHKLSISDLLSSTTGLSSDVALLDRSSSGIKPKGKGKAHTATLPIPLDTRTSERLGREAAYDDTKEEVSYNWDGTMNRLRGAEFLQFPLQKPSEPKRSDLELASKFKPSNALESSIDALLQKAQLASDKAMLETEDHAIQMQLAKNEVSREEVAKRRAELRQMRELMLRSEMKARRANKIKSKIYRKLRRKEKAKLNADNSSGNEDNNDEQKAALERIKKRAGAKVKLKKRSVAQLEDNSDEDMDANKELDREERLATLISGKVASVAEENVEDSEEEGADGEWDISQARKELIALQSSFSDATEGQHKGVFAMRFMQEATKRKEREGNENVEQILKQLDEEFGDDQTNDSEPSSKAKKTAVQRTGGGGRMTFKPGENANSEGPSTTLSDQEGHEGQQDEIDHDAKSPSRAATPPSSQTKGLLSASSTTSASSSSNPWLARAPSHVAQKKRNEVLISKNLSKGERGAMYRISKNASTNPKNSNEGPDTSSMDIDMSNTMTLNDSTTAKKPTKDVQTADHDNSNDEDDEVQHQEKMLEASRKGRKNQLKSFEQKELVALAFAGDGAVQNFDQIKQKEIMEDAPKEIDMTLPGWGSWAGNGVRQNPNKKPNPNLIKKLPGIKAEHRQDAGRKHLIISEKADKKAAQYLVRDLPYPYTSRAQYDRSLAQPVGKEWNTRVGFGRNTLPKVSVRPGTVIEPLKLEKTRK